MKLRAYEGKKVIVITSDEHKYVGVMTDYIFPEDNEPEGIESIILDGELEITGPEIVAIK